MKWLACELFEEKIKKYLEYTGGDYEEVCRKSKKLLKTMPIPLSVIVLISLFISKILILSAVGVGLIVYFYPLLYSWSRKEEYKKSVNQEAPLISIIAYVNSLVDKNVLHTMEELARIKDLKVPSVEYQMIRKRKEVLNESTYRAIERRAILHKGDLLGKVYFKFLIASDLGASIRDRMREAMNEVLQYYKEEYKNYVDRSSEFAEIIFAVYLLLPIVLVGFQFTFKVNPVQLLLPLLFTPAFIFLISIIQPSGDYSIKLNYKQFLPLIALVPIILLPISITVKLSGIITVIALSLFWVYNQVRVANYLLNQIPDILKEMSDYMKIGYSTVTAFSKLQPREHGPGSEILNEIISKTSLDNEIPEVKTPSVFFNNIMNVLRVLSKTGLSSVGLEELSDLVNEIVNLRSSIIRQLRLFDAMLILTPIMLWLTFSMLGHIFTNSENNLESIVIFTYSLATALIFSKLSRFTSLYLPSVIIPLIISTILSVFPHGV
ncbi:membrane pilin protein UpsF [Stygiolobus caldivivus]|uniref:Type II secretion system protein GspF domain-containing protein n=1 Tax=Stygiolobus caldivivus TaxID=2824673 RepID=A0A8D5ZKE2_9CREN|nr:hypothetical protein [Stygiolobus caldivivus]BCU71295.1 hypothetical protein KN1_25920 [Stygiolobus caldivivus]